MNAGADKPPSRLEKNWNFKGLSSEFLVIY